MFSNSPDKAATEAQFPLVPGDDVEDALDMYTLMQRGHREEGVDSAYEYIVNNPSKYKNIINEDYIMNLCYILTNLMNIKNNETINLTKIMKFFRMYLIN